MIRTALAALTAIATLAHAAPAGPRPGLLPGATYPIDVVLSEPAARFHWLDSLAGLDLPGGSAGKTVEVHRAEFLRVLGPPTAEDREHLRRFAEVRVRFAERRYAEWQDQGEADFSDLLASFLGVDDEASAVRLASAHLAPEDLDALVASLDHFRARYRAIWQNGRWADPFLEDARRGRNGRRLADMLARQARFFGVDLPIAPVPRVVLVPVPPGAGTHASAHGRLLLIELRPADRLADTASVIAHENAHVLFDAMPEELRSRVQAVFTSRGEAGVAAWSALQEALPTALGQGVADRKFRHELWSPRHPWYHREDIDRYAKAIYPAVDRAFRRGRTFDVRLAGALADAWTGASVAGKVTPRSP